MQVEQEKRRSFYEQLRVYLDGSSAAFDNQVVARQRLVELLRERQGSLPDLEYEDLFREKVKDFNDEERSLCELMRGITKESMYKHNQGMVTLLEKNPQHRAELPDFTALQEHLDLWLSKYRALEDRQDWCLVFVGVEENKPFPPTTGDQVNKILEEITQQ